MYSRVGTWQNVPLKVLCSIGEGSLSIFESQMKKIVTPDAAHSW